MTPEGKAFFEGLRAADVRDADAAMAEELARMEARTPIIDEMMAADPKLGYLSAVVMAGDKLSMVRSQEWVAQGCPPEDAVTFVGSYYRLAFAVWAVDHAGLEESWLLDRLPELWRGSDPDDTDPRFLALWQAAFKRNGFRYVRDGKPLPRGQMLTLFRGQDDGAPLGIAWSLDKDVAEKFARGAGTRQSSRPGLIIETHVPRFTALAFLTGRGESEVILPTIGTDYVETSRTTLEEVVVV